MEPRQEEVSVVKYVFANDMHLRYSLATALALAGTAFSCSAEARYTIGLSKLMRRRGRSFIGTAVTLRGDAQEATIYSKTVEFNSITPENAMKFESTEPSRGNFTLDDAERYTNFASSHGMQIHCHTLIHSRIFQGWHSQLPAWVTNGNFDNATIIDIMRDHIRGIAGQFKGRCTRCYVVNEALDEDGTYRESVCYNTIGDAFIPLAFKFASQVDPKAQIFYNDYNPEYNGAKTDGAQRIVKLVKSHGVKINGVGLQAHLTSEATTSSGGSVAPSQQDLASALREITSQDVDVAYTEVDVRMNLPATKKKLNVQAKVYQRVAASCLSVQRCVGMTTWGVYDKYSWIPGVFDGEGAALMWNEDFDRKPAYFGFLKGIESGGKKG